MQKIKIHTQRIQIDWAGVRYVLSLTLFCAMLGLAAFGWGYIYRDREADEIRKQVSQLEIKTRDINGRLVGVEATVKKMGR
jgi:hypothetical protein